ncbi:DTW domain-containing protein [Microbulbifer sp. Q7]|uniref:DTW domain-containing protein n=1 Tax=Microbulbifer sp. Q7 TaxID=1785091 RepID=UPI0008348FF9|nr:tRNA-uridine aminocarboxypropyltransferase [Microbulbifer sp. Q7]
MHIIVLTHERELARPTNTGQLALTEATTAVVQRIVWQRTDPDPGLLSIVSRPDVGLVYPVSEVPTEKSVAQPLSVEACNTFIVLDATWQEARKMYNRSAYLHGVARVSVDAVRPSRYALRRNQKQGGLCTAECVVEILRRKGRDLLAADLESRFLQFNTQNERPI